MGQGGELGRPAPGAELRVGRPGQFTDVGSEDKGETDDIDGITKLSDNIAKVMASAKRIAKGITKDEIIDVIIDLEQWMMQRAETNEELTPELLTTINGLHKKYIEYISAQEA